MPKIKEGNRASGIDRGINSSNTDPKSRIKIVAQVVFDLFEEEDGLDALFGLLQQSLPERLFETAYALGCDVAAADGMLQEVELRFLQEIRHEFNIDRLHGAAIERGARARHLLDN